jgi:hypothetical protein
MTAVRTVAVKKVEAAKPARLRPRVTTKAEPRPSSNSQKARRSREGRRDERAREASAGARSR